MLTSSTTLWGAQALNEIDLAAADAEEQIHAALKQLE